MTNKILILDGIGGVPLGREIAETCKELGRETIYLDLAELDKIPLYRMRSILAKTMNKQQDQEGFFHLPRAQEKQLEAVVRSQRPAYILVIGFIYRFISPEFIRKLSNTYNIKLFLYDTDSCNIYSKRREFIFFLSHELTIYKQIFSFSSVMTNFFRQTCQLDATYLPYGAMQIDISKHLSDQSHDVLFVGSADLRRIFLLEHIRDNLTIYGSRWERNNSLMTPELKSKIKDQSVWGKELHQLVADSKIVLNITRAQFYGAETGINLRIFEALAVGSFLLTDYCDEVAELFNIGTEIETFKSSAELKEKVDHYLHNSEQRLSIAQQGHQAFQQRFTWKTRVRALLDAMDV